MRDGCLWIIHAASPMHERGRSERWFTRKPRIEKYAGGVRDVPAVGCRKLHEQIVRMLAVDQVRPAVRRLAAPEQEWITAGSHERVRREHSAQAERAIAERPLRHRHDHPADERFVAAARAT